MGVLHKRTFRPEPVEGQTGDLGNSPSRADPIALPRTSARTICQVLPFTTFGTA
jgi:hypothetical protein